MKNKYNKYYIGYLPEDSQDFITVDEMMGDIDYYKNVNIKMFMTHGVQFACDIPTESGSMSYCDTITNNDVLEYTSLSSLIDDFIFGYESNNDSEDESDEGVDEFDNGYNPEERINYFMEGNDFIIIKQNIKTKKYSLVDRETIFNCFNQLMNKIENELMGDTQYFDDAKYVLDIDDKSFDNMLEGFHESIEKHIEQDCCQITISDAANNYYCDTIIKCGSKFEKEIIDNGDGDTLNTPNSRGYIFDGDYNEYKNYIKHHLKQGMPLGCAVSTVITDYDITDEAKVFTKCYGYIIGFKENEVVISQLPASEVSKAYSFKAETGETIPSKRNIIYCGYKKDDIVCGFDL